MGRTAKQGISFYRMNSGHIRNKKVRLLFNEFDSDGYYIWCCLLDYAYEKWGYYFDSSDVEELELFASEYCKKKLGLVKEVIAGCIRRDLFDKAVYDSFGILTSEMMQDTWIKATAERRSAGTVFHISKNYLLITFKNDIPINLEIYQPINKIDHPIYPEDQSKNTQIRVDENREDKIRSEKNPTGGAPAEPSPPRKGGRKKGEEEVEPFWAQLVKIWFDFGLEKFGVEPSFERDDPKIFKRIIHRLKKRATQNKAVWNEVTGPQRLRYFLDSAYQDEWLEKHFLLANLEKQFDVVIQKQREVSKKKATQGSSDLQYLYDRFLDGELNPVLITTQHFEQMVSRKLLSAEAWQKQIAKRVKNLTGSNQGNELRLLQAYQDGKDVEERRADVPVLMRMAVVDAFGYLKSKNINTLPDVVA